MPDLTGHFPGKPARSRRPNRRAVIMMICSGLTFASLVTCCTVAVAVATMLNRLGSAFESAFEAVFSGLLDGFATIFLALLLLLFSVFTVFMVLLTLLSTGQIIPFFMRMARLLTLI
jgi:hypothetical protein